MRLAAARYILLSAGLCYRRERYEEHLAPPPPPPNLAMNPLWKDVKPSTTLWNVSSAGRMVVLWYGHIVYTGARQDAVEQETGRWGYNNKIYHNVYQ